MKQLEGTKNKCHCQQEVVGIISVIMMQSVSGAPKINYNQDHVENVAEGGIKQGYLYYDEAILQRKNS